jgi:hypothetical protein
MADREIIRNRWRRIGTDKAWDAGYQSLARCLNNTQKLFVPALSDANESIASERGSAAAESSDEEQACTDLLEATLAIPYCSKIPVEIVLGRTPAGGGEFFLVSRVRTRICCLNSSG